jgi:glyoxalase family protein
MNRNGANIMQQAIRGLHHVTALASDPQRNVDFYTQVLGQRLVKRTVNFDDPGTYHLYYGDNVGSPGTIMTFFPWPHARRGTLGNGEVAATAYAIGPDSVAYWLERLQQHRVQMFQTQIRFGAEVIPFADPDGMILELIVREEGRVPEHWVDGPVPAAHALRGFHGVTIWTGAAEPSTALLTEQMGYTLVAEEGARLRFQAAAAEEGHLGIAPYLDLLVRPNQPAGRMGAGSVHHVAFQAADDAEQAEWQRILSAADQGVTEVKDRQYFRSIYFREPSGVLYEIATNGPGFPVDEAASHLGIHLKLPSWLEPQRERIEQALPPLVVPEYAARSE